ncbi:hypothetical protein HAX54_039616, partial [Datura stramonium]|nr:hypothetical protein [Datura stramonium]
DWTCKIKVVDKCRPKDNKDKIKKYQLLILQDEEENQVQAIIFNDDITHFEDLLTPFNIYLVSIEQVKESTYGYENSINKFTWTIDKSTIVEHIESVTHVEDPLSPPT